MNRTMGIVFLILGVVMLGYGVAANDSVTSGVSRLFTGAPTTKTIVLIIGGLVLAITGALSLRGRN